MTRIRLIQKKVRIITNYIYQNIIKMKMIIKGKDMKEKGLQNNKVMQEKKKNIQNIKEVVKAMIKDLLRKNIKVKSLKFLIMIAIKFMEIYLKIKVNNLNKKIVEMNMKIKNMIIDQIETKNIINKIKKNTMINKILKIYKRETTLDVQTHLLINKSTIETDHASILMIDQVLIKIDHLKIHQILIQ